jgi:HK97 family phage major capsid protein
MDLTETIKALGTTVNDFMAKYNQRFTDLSKQVDNIETVLGRNHSGGGVFSVHTDSTEAREHKEAFLAFIRKGGNEDKLRAFEASLSTLSDPDGGYLVAEEMEKEIERLATDSVAMRRLAKVIKVKGEYKRPMSTGGTESGWVGETETRSETEASELQLFAPFWSEIYAYPKVTQKLLDLSDFDVEGWMIDEISESFTEEEGEAFITGNGVKKPFGIVDTSKMVANASWEYGKLGYVTTGSANSILADSLFDLQHSLKPVYRRNGIFLMNDTTLSVIRKMKDGEGNYIVRAGLAEGAPDILLGKPIEIDDNMPDIGENAYPIAFGDFKRAYTIVDHPSGIRVLRDPYTTKGYVKFYVIKRVAAGINNTQAVKFLKVSA